MVHKRRAGSLSAFCDGELHNMSNLTYMWEQVTCPKCLEERIKECKHNVNKWNKQLQQAEKAYADFMSAPLTEEIKIDLSHLSHTKECYTIMVGGVAQLFQFNPYTKMDMFFEMSSKR